MHKSNVVPFPDDNQKLFHEFLNLNPHFGIKDGDVLTTRDAQYYRYRKVNGVRSFEKLDEPPFMFSPTMKRGYYFVKTPSGSMSLLMSRGHAKRLAAMYNDGTTFKRHSQAPTIWPKLFLATVAWVWAIRLGYYVLTGK